MKWFLALMVVVGVALIVWGNAISNGPGSADERIAGAFPVLAGIGFVVAGIVIAFVWLVFRA